MLIGNSFALCGGPENVGELLKLLEDGGTNIKGNPDVYVREYKQFGIDEARELRMRASLKGTSGRRIFVVVAPDMNREAQNALLKTLEEPPADARFFFIVRSPETLLPTLRSRLQILVGDEPNVIGEAKQFLAATPQKRLDMLKPLLEKDDDDKRDLSRILKFLASLEDALAKNRDGLEHIYRARKYIADRGALVKPLLEQVALLVPRM